jgi:nucleotide-binding universal stress UspA family protein
MKKVLLAFDGSSFSERAFDFVRRLNDIQPLLVTGVFVPQVAHTNVSTYSPAAAFAGAYVPMIDDEDTESMEKNIAKFESLCRKNSISYRIHKDFVDFALPELKKESRFADVLIISGELFYRRYIELDHYDYLRDLLHESECPVLVLPEHFQFPDSNILAYDGSEESVYAIRQFAYLFPELSGNNTLLVYAQDKSRSGIPSKDYIVELATQHYKNLTFYKLNVNPRKYFSTWIRNEKGSVLVSGSFGRSAFSQIFRKSFVADIIKDHKIPVFIAHK